MNPCSYKRAECARKGQRIYGVWVCDKHLAAYEVELQKNTQTGQDTAQATVEALQRERDEAIEAASLPTWVCDGCGRVSSEGWINRVIDSFEGTDYEMECPTCGVRAIEEDCASDLVRERDDLQAALDAERELSAAWAEKARQYEIELDGDPQNFHGQGRTIGVREQLSQLQALLRAYFKVRSGNDQNKYAQAYAALKATLDATTPAKFTKEELSKWWHAQCPQCGWNGLSRDCAGGEPLADTGDFNDPMCPMCAQTGRCVVVDDYVEPKGGDGE